MADTKPRDEEKHVSEKVVEGCDVGVEALTGAVSHIDPDGPEAKRVLRKIDLHLMPLLMITYSKSGGETSTMHVSYNFRLMLMIP